MAEGHAGEYNTRTSVFKYKKGLAGCGLKAPSLPRPKSARGFNSKAFRAFRRAVSRCPAGRATSPLKVPQKSVSKPSATCTWRPASAKIGATCRSFPCRVRNATLCSKMCRMASQICHAFSKMRNPRWRCPYASSLSIFLPGGETHFYPAFKIFVIENFMESFWIELSND